MAAGAEFVEGWLVAQVLGEGAYGEVRLLVHARSGAAVALKVVRGAGAGGGEEGTGGAGSAAAREAALHRALRHPHVLRCLGERTHQGLHYMFLEYAPGGELFDRIEPDVGMREDEARRYWCQLLDGLQYLHGRGVAHRDIKPENLLLDNRDQLKISDFGMATLFRHGARERLMSRVCGTAPYAAPEVLRATERAYRAPPADLWAAALVLLAMLAGELPWERACDTDERYAAWSAWSGGAAPSGPWRKLSAPALALLRRALLPDAERRAPLPALLEQPWTREPAGRAARTWRSQPNACSVPAELSVADMDALISYSQPAQADSLAPGAPGGRRRTRVWLRAGPARALCALHDALRLRGYVGRRLHPRLMAIECGTELKMRAWAMPCGGDAGGGDAGGGDAGGGDAGGGDAGGGDAGGARTLLEFRRSRGCGLQFKRRYVELRDALQPLHAPAPPGSELLHVSHYAT